MTLRALLIDEDSSARQKLIHLLQHFDNIQVAGEAANASEALALTEKLNCQLIFLDISLPDLEEKQLAHLLKEKESAPWVIFTTSQEEYALAFAVHQQDFLLQPITSEQLAEALQKVHSFKNESPALSPNLPSADEDKPGTLSAKLLELVPVEQKGKIIILHQEDIIFVYTDKDNVFIKTQTESYLTRFTLRELEARLNPDLFFRSHRCYLVNTRRMRELVPYLNGTYTIIVDDDEKSEIPMSRTKSRVLKEMLGL